MSHCCWIVCSVVPGRHLIIAIRKKFVYDDNHQPVKVIISYQDWLEIERLLDLRKEKILHTDVSKFRGTLTLTKDPV